MILKIFLTQYYRQSSLTIEFYKNSWAHSDYTPLSDSTLWKILKAINPSQRKSLSGLDDVTADAINGFDFLEKRLNEQNGAKELISRLERAKRYLKTNFKDHCNGQSTIKTHNTAFALSFVNEELCLEVNEESCLEVNEEPCLEVNEEPCLEVNEELCLEVNEESCLEVNEEPCLEVNEESCLEVNEEVCAECFNVSEILEIILNIALLTENEDLKYDVQRSVNNIISYMKHQIRDQQQKQAKVYAFANLDHVTGFWLRDYSQKILPMSFREGMKTYFGKKGMSVHVDVFFTRSMSEELEKRVYLSMIYRCDQNKIDTMNIAAHVISEFSKDYPNVVKLFLKSDNAGCYHGNNILEPLYNLCKNSNIKLLRCDFNEPCKGKDQCDRESAGAKRVINSYLESG